MRVGSFTKSSNRLSSPRGLVGSGAGLGRMHAHLVEHAGQTVGTESPVLGEPAVFRDAARVGDPDVDLLAGADGAHELASEGGGDVHLPHGPVVGDADDVADLV